MARLYRPSVTKQETKEYQAYCSQFRTAALDKTYRVLETDLQVYDNAISLASPGAAAPDDRKRLAIDPALVAHIRNAALDADGVASLQSSNRLIPAQRAPQRPASRMADSNNADARAKAYSAWLCLANV